MINEEMRRVNKQSGKVAKSARTIPKNYQSIIQLLETLPSSSLNLVEQFIRFLMYQAASNVQVASFDTDFDQIPWLRRLSMADD